MNCKQNESFMAYPGYPHILVSNQGRVWNNNTNKFITHQNLDGYMHSSFGGRSHLVHRLVATLFVHNSDPSIKTQIDHLDSVKSNNNHYNLEWVTPSQNQKRINRIGMQFLNATQVEDILKQCLCYGHSARSMARKYQKDPSTIAQIVRGATWKHIDRSQFVNN